MALQFLPIAIVLVVLTFRLADGDVYFVSPNVTNCQGNVSCNTLSYYAKFTSQQYSNSVFYFMPGTHLLQQVWVIENVSNLTLTGRSPNSETDEEVIVECTNSSTARGVQVMNGRNIRLKYMSIFNCPQGKKLASAFFCNSTNSLELSNVTIRSSKGSCLVLTNCNDYVITNSEFTNGTYNHSIHVYGSGIFADGLSSGKLTSIKLLNNDYGICIHDTIGNVTIQLEWIYASHNKIFDFWFNLCSANISIRRSRFLDSGGFFASQVCILPEVYEIEMQQCSFFALKRGIAIFVSQARYLEINITSCSVTDSSGGGFHLGLQWYPGIAIIHNRHGNGTEQDEPRFIIQNVTIQDIHVPDISVPVLFLYAIPLVEITDVSILNNGHGGLVLYDCVAVFRGTNTFRNNSAIYGGGMALYANSYMSLESNTTMHFIDNKAVKFGSGIFVSQDDSWPWINLCFINLADINTSRINFEGNEAKYTGNTLYGGKVETCLAQDSYDTNLTVALGLLRNATPCGQTNVSSDAERLVFCDGICINTSKTEKSVYVYPGESLNQSIAALGQLNGSTQANVVLHYDEVFDHHTQDETEFINVTCTYIIRDILVNRTNTQANIALTLSNDYDPHFFYGDINITVHLLPCPAGFEFSKKNKVCVCSENIQEYAQCDITSQNITRTNTSWIYPTKGNIMFFKHCPFDYCNNESFNVNSPDDQCNHSRIGILCGDCEQNYSMILGSNKCLNCTGQAWKIPLVLLGSALAGIVLVAVLIVLNFTVSVGTINGLLFFVNVVKIYESVFLKELCPFWLRLYSWLNLDLGISTCFCERMDACGKVGLQFVFPMYLLLLVMVIVAVCRCGQWIGLRSLPWVVKLSDKTASLMGSKIIPVLATLVLFSYTKLIRTMILIYHKADVQMFESNPSASDHTYIKKWYVNGSMTYLESCHKTLFGFGSLAVPFIAFFTLFLLLFPRMERHLPQFKFWISWHMRLKPFYDAYGGPYKDEYRFWTGLLLLVRCLLVVVVTVVDDTNVASNILLWVCLILIPMVALLQVYKSFILNLLETFYLSAILAMVYLSTVQNDKHVQMYLVLSISPCLLICILIFHTYQRVKPTRLAVLLRKLITDIKKDQSYKEEVHLANNSDDSDETSLSAATVSIVSLDELREPLMENSNL